MFIHAWMGVSQYVDEHSGYFIGGQIAGSIQQGVLTAGAGEAVAGSRFLRFAEAVEVTEEAQATRRSGRVASLIRENAEEGAKYEAKVFKTLHIKQIKKKELHYGLDQDKVVRDIFLDHVDHVAKIVTEIKRVKKLSLTRQIAAQLDYEKTAGYQFRLVVPCGCRLSAPLERALRVATAIVIDKIPLYIGAKMNLTVTMLVRKRLISRRDGARYMSILNAFPNITPEKCDSAEPIRGRYDSQNMEAALEYWGNTFLWKRKKPSVSGGVFSATYPYSDQHSMAFVDTKEASLMPDIRSSIFQTACAVGMDFGLLHTIALPEIASGVASNSMRMIDPALQKYNLSMSTHEIRRYIPDLYWGTVFGKPYMDLFGGDRLMSAPAYQVEEVAQDCFWLQLTKDIADMHTDYEAVDRVRQAVKNHLNPNAFFQLHLGTDHQYDVPDFGF